MSTGNGGESPHGFVMKSSIPVLGLENYCESLIAKGANSPKPSLVDPRDQRKYTDLNIYDLFGNLLVFCSQTTEE